MVALLLLTLFVCVVFFALGLGRLSVLTSRIAALEQKLGESTKMLECIKVTLLASLNDAVPSVAVEFGRKVLYSTERPGFAELEKHVKGAAKAAAAKK